MSGPLFLSVSLSGEANMSAMPKFEIYQDNAGKFRFRLKAANGEVIAVGEAYESKDGCKNGIESIKTNAPIAEIIEVTE